MTFNTSSSPGLRARVVPQFPAMVVANSPLSVHKSGLTYTFDFDASAVQFSAVKVTAGGNINFGNGDVLVTHSTNTLAFSGATLYSFDAAVTISGVLTTNGQILFPAAQNASSNPNTLDDYEEGTWTPTITFVTSGNLTVVYATQLGTYTKIGRLVTLSFNIQTSTFTHSTASGNFQITGLPFASSNVLAAVGALVWRGITKASYTHVVAVVGPNSAIINLSISGSGQADATVAVGDMPTGGTIKLQGTISYIV